MLPATEHLRTGDGARPPLGAFRRNPDRHRSAGRP